MPGKETLGILRQRHYAMHPTFGRIGIDLDIADDSDKEFIVNLSRNVFNVYGPYEKTIPQWFESGMVLTAMASLEESPVGFVMLGDFSVKFDLKYGSEILAIAVAPKMQGAGIGDMLLKTIEREAAHCNVKWLFLHTAVENLPAHNLFNRNGFRTMEVKIKFYPAGQDAIVMAKRILD